MRNAMMQSCPFNPALRNRWSTFFCAACTMHAMLSQVQIVIQAASEHHNFHKQLLKSHGQQQAASRLLGMPAAGSASPLCPVPALRACGSACLARRGWPAPPDQSW